ncbi:MAG: DNA helicase, partial [Proteobacteria bacterium]
MEIIEETALSTFSFAKFLMWKDLVDRTDDLRKNRLVKHLIDSPEKAYASLNASFQNPREMDRTRSPSDMISLLPADSSQLAACIAAAEGLDFVIVGPPGTGKSQTIANMIAQCLAVGKTVLFVAEKTTALNVVYRRLCSNGLESLCLELHSNKADRRNFVAQLKHSWETTNTFAESEWISINEKLKIRRDQLNSYVDALHKVYPNGLSAYKAFGTTIANSDRFAPKVAWQSINAHDDSDLQRLQELATELGRIYKSVKHLPVLQQVQNQEWSYTWQESLLSTANNLILSTKELKDSIKILLNCLSLDIPEVVDSDILAILSNSTNFLSESPELDSDLLHTENLRELHNAVEGLEISIAKYKVLETNSSAKFSAENIRLIPIDSIDNQWRQASASIFPWLGRRRVKKMIQSYIDIGVVDPKSNIESIRQMKRCLIDIETNLISGKKIGYSGLNSNTKEIKLKIEAAMNFKATYTALSQFTTDSASFSTKFSQVYSNEERVRTLNICTLRFKKAFQIFTTTFSEFEILKGEKQGISPRTSNLETLEDQATELIRSKNYLRDWSVWCKIRQNAINLGLEDFVVNLTNGSIDGIDTSHLFVLSYSRWWLPHVVDSDPILREFRLFQHEHSLNDFRELDELVRKATAARVSSILSHGLPEVQSVPRSSELGLLRHQMELTRPSKSIREIISLLPENFSKLAPCMLMSPLSIAQYLPAGKSPFDVVIFDEASQITTWDAIGAIARGKQTIIVGDPKQLPPTNFFGKNEDDDDEIIEHEKDLESILDESKASGLPVHDLRWHYRSRNESLIAFSNHHYYQNRLITFPSPSVIDRAVKFVHVDEGIFDRGKSRTNTIEARIVVSEATSRMKQWLLQPEDKRLSLAILTFNIQQQKLIEDLLDSERRLDPKLEWFFADDRIEPTIVKNLENIQGDERDLILFS